MRADVHHDGVGIAVDHGVMVDADQAGSLDLGGLNRDSFDATGLAGYGHDGYLQVSGGAGRV